jgi:hypothetical protein
MPIKKISVTFDLPIGQFLGMLAAGNSGMKIDVFGDEPKVSKKMLNGHAPKLLEGPKRKSGATPGSSRSIIMGALKGGEKVPLAQLRSLLKEAGFPHPNLASSMLHTMRKDGVVKRVGAGKYQITPTGTASLKEDANG